MLQAHQYSPPRVLYFLVVQTRGLRSVYRRRRQMGNWNQSNRLSHDFWSRWRDNFPICWKKSVEFQTSSSESQVRWLMRVPSYLFSFFFFSWHPSPGPNCNISGPLYMRATREIANQLYGGCLQNFDRNFRLTWRVFETGKVSTFWAMSQWNTNKVLNYIHLIPKWRPINHS